MFSRITINPNIMNGKACIRGLNITVSSVVAQVALGSPWEKILTTFPGLELGDIQQSLEYAAWLTSEEARTST